MWHVFQSLVNPVSVNYQDNFHQWEIWQGKQPRSHFIRSQIYEQYLLRRPHFIEEDSNYTKGQTYVLGKFINFLRPNDDLVTYLTILLDLYDCCKGYSRLLFDPPGIIELRHSLLERDLSILYRHDYRVYAFDYTKIHAHTVAIFSLSTLVMRFVSNAIDNNFSREIFPTIDRNICLRALDNKTFGPPILKCEHCRISTDILLGNFNLCQDCFYRRCIICNDVATTKHTDNFPRCYIHR